MPLAITDDTWILIVGMILTAVTSLVAPIISSIVNYYQAKANKLKLESVEEQTTELHKSMNSMKDQLVQVTKSDALQRGHAQGVADEKAKAANQETT